MKPFSRALIRTLALSAIVGGLFHAGGDAAAQRRRRPAPARSQAPSSRIDYTKFLHSTKQHQSACLTCHKVPTSNWRTAGEYPDVADYPDHHACVSCHRQQFFKGAKPPICAVCHSRVSPRDDVRFTFRNPAGRRQFHIEFPHDKHQDVIAKLLPGVPHNTPVFIPASFKPQDKLPHYNNCEICHGPRNAPAQAPPSGWIDRFAPDNQTLKSIPSSHASCFSCHWKSQEPVNSNCGGCHKLSAQSLPANLDVPKRLSMKFRHGREQHVLECAACHIHITKSALVRGLKPDVPITSCSECHNKAPSHLEISNELAAVDKNRDFVCVYCHTSDVGRRDPPASHYLISERPPILRKDVK